MSDFAASPPDTTDKIKVDQFGYFPNARKVVIVDPQVGSNSSESYNPGTGNNDYEVRRWDNDQVVFTARYYRTMERWRYS